MTNREKRYTKGPWKSAGIGWIGEGGKEVIISGGPANGSAHDYPEAKHNSQIVMAAPELLELLEIAECPACDGSGAYYDNYGEVRQCQWCDERDKAIAKAYGEGDDK